MVAPRDAAPLSKHQARGKSSRTVKRSHAPPISPSANTMPPSLRGGKRPRPSDASDVEKPATAIRKKEGMKAVGGKVPGTPTTEGSSYRKGMFLAFIDDAFAQRHKGNNERYTELVSQFRSLIPSSSQASGPSAASTSSTAPPPPTTSQLRIWLEALTHVVSKLDETHGTLVETILALPWATMDDSFVGAYMRFIGALVSARPEWLRLVLEKCVKGFKYRSNYTVGSPAAMPSITRRILYGRLHSLLRMLLSLIPTLSPSLSPLLAINFPSKRDTRFAQICYIDNLLALTEYCPALADDVLSLVVERALNIDVEIQGEPEEWEDVEEEMLAGAQPEVVDVNSLVDRPTAEDEDEDSSDDDDDDDGELNLEDELESDDEPDLVDDDEAARKVSKDKKMSDETIRKILENRSKLDAILKVVFDHLAVVHTAPTHTSFPPPATPGHDSTETTPTPETAPSAETLQRRLTLFNTLLDIFDRSLLRTFKTRNVQFLLFYLCSLDVASSDRFIGVLLGRAFENDTAAVTRVAAAGYVASFISRAKFVDAGMTRKVVGLLCRFLEEQMDALANGVSAGGDLPVFYAVAQAVFYIFCFRWKDLMDEGDEDDLVLDTGRRWMLGLETIKRAVGSSYNPLKVCAQPVVNQFATIAHKTNFLYCYAILESNRRVASRESYSMAPPPTSNGTNGRPYQPAPPSRSSSTSTITAAPRQLLVAEEMDSFFPFDPFKLPLSSVYIDDIYRDWVADDESSTSETSSEDSEDTDSDSDDNSSVADDDTGPLPMAMGGGLAVPGLNKSDGLDEEFARSLEMMSLSPEDESFGGRRRAEAKYGSLNRNL
ncbi:RNA polymerase I-specific transcription initiation factor RRN3-domain-containing protein [Leucosporidium creatinivorum]|uniref:RNA polymerase I-specific transcription initiation factor RRN3-domain-containing protein n=1 Tax=Leucosporidium creatinivorum TaxID=106004 RepID=A0A1Y2G172_9BASI|nr:RNA polymerase I-specific transcription initiation factor RRN3-domain-containing protein [Leucosporidium creatinivorum]